MKAMVTLTVPEGKRLIARAIAQMPEVQRAREQGKILLKGGTTVSAIAEELVGVPLRISGRISPRGLRSAMVVHEAVHNMLIEGPHWRRVDDNLAEAARQLRRGDVLVLGANLIDVHGGAAIMAGARFGGYAGQYLSGLSAEGIPILVAAGLEKLIPGTVQGAIRVAGRQQVDLSIGMAVGLIPICGQVITEVEALKLLAPVECQVVGKGGVDGAEGGAVLAFWGEEGDVKRLFRLVLDLKGATTSALPESMVECIGASNRCRDHRACIYRSPKLADVILSSRRPQR